MAGTSALKTELQPSLHIGILHAMLAFGSAYSDEPDTVVDTCRGEGMADKENGIRLAGRELPRGGRVQRQLDLTGQWRVANTLTGHKRGLRDGQRSLYDGIGAPCRLW